MKPTLKTLGLVLTGMIAFNTDSLASSTLVQSTGFTDETLFIILCALAIFQLVVIRMIADVIKSLTSAEALWKGVGKKGGAAAILLLFMLISGSANAAGDYDQLINMDDTGFMMLVTLNLFLFLTFIYLVTKLNQVMGMLRKCEGMEEASFMQKIEAMLTRSVPIEEEATVEMDHEYDGIRELDNRLPPWWLYGFYASIVFAVVYMFNYHILENSPLQTEEYAIAMEEAATKRAAALASEENPIDESNVIYLSDAGSLASGQKNFQLLCKSCHGESGGSQPGGVGPNLTDEYWLHGGSIAEVFTTIKYGVPAKGMVSWEAQLSPKKMQEVASYILSIQGSNPPNAKGQQGELYVPETPVEEAPANDSTETKAAEEIKETVALNH